MTTEEINNLLPAALAEAVATAMEPRPSELQGGVTSKGDWWESHVVGTVYQWRACEIDGNAALLLLDEIKRRGWFVLLNCDDEGWLARAYVNERMVENSAPDFPTAVARLFLAVTAKEEDCK